MKGQEALECLLLIGGAILVAVIVITLLLSITDNSPPKYFEGWDCVKEHTKLLETVIIPKENPGYSIEGKPSAEDGRENIRCYEDWIDCFDSECKGKYVACNQWQFDRVEKTCLRYIQVKELRNKDGSLYDPEVKP